MTDTTNHDDSGTEGQRPAREMLPVREPVRPALTSAQLKAAAEALKQETRKVEEQQKEAEREEHAREAAAKKRDKELKEAQANVQRDLDEIRAVMMKELPGFDQLAARVEAATARYTEIARGLGDRFPEESFVRHPAHKSLPWLKTLAAPKGQ